MTLESQYKQYLKDNVNSVYTFEEWKENVLLPFMEDAINQINKHKSICDEYENRLNKLLNKNNMEIQKVVTLMGDRIYLSFFVDENHTFDIEDTYMWFEDIEGKSLDIGDNYDYFIDESNKEEIKTSLKKLFSDEKGLYKELKTLINKMNEYQK